MAEKETGLESVPETELDEVVGGTGEEVDAGLETILRPIGK